MNSEFLCAKGIPLLYWDKDLALGHSSRLFFCVWRNRTTVDKVAVLASAIKEYVRNRTTKMAILTLIEPTAKVPEISARLALTRLIKTQGDRVVMAGIVYEGDGFKAAVVRSIAVGLSGLTKQFFPHRFFASVEDMADALALQASELGLSFPAADTLREVAEFRRQLRAAGDEQARFSHLSSRPPLFPGI